MADDKWIAGLKGDMPVAEAAKRVLALRLGVVRDRLPAAVFRAEEDIEHVHQLRVGTRRAAAALRIFRQCLPEKLAEKTRKALRQIRRSAGEARDWDVFLEFLQTRLRRCPVKQKRGLDFLFGVSHGRRMLAQEHLKEAHDAKAEKFTLRIQQVQQALGASSGPGPSLSDLAAPTLAELLHELETAARSDLMPYDALHQVRILGKQLRYAMEIFECCFGPDFRQKHYPAIVQMQEILGLANDSHVACQRLGGLRSHLLRTHPQQWPHYQDGIESLLMLHEKRLPTQRRAFEKWWHDWQQSGADGAFAALIQEH